MDKIYTLADSQGYIQPVEERCVVWDGEGKTALSCYKDKNGITKHLTRLVNFSKKGPNVMIQGRKYYISNAVSEVNETA